MARWHRWPAGAGHTAVHEIQQAFEVHYSYPVTFTRGVFSERNDTFCRVLRRAGERRHRILPVLDSGLVAADPTLSDRLARYARAHTDLIELVGAPLLVRGGEICKSDPREVDELRAMVERHGLCRHSFILAVGGGSVLDAMGYAAATVHRGVRFIRMPTTVLAQNDAGVGTKNAINYRGRKNFIGTFAPPFAVINDLDMLATLLRRDLRSGIAEALKVALIKDSGFFEALHRGRAQLAAFEPDAMEEMIVRCTELHLEHIRTNGDPFELGSARPLDFGHWLAHKLEAISGYELRHGEAVAVGIAVDSLYSERLGMISRQQLEAILTTLEGVGFDIHHPGLVTLDIEQALAEFREHLGGELSITLLDGIGRGIEVNRIDTALMGECVAGLSNGR